MQYSPQSACSGTVAVRLTGLEVRLGRIKAALTVLILSCVGDGLAASYCTEPKYWQGFQTVTKIIIICIISHIISFKLLLHYVYIFVIFPRQYKWVYFLP